MYRLCITAGGRRHPGFCVPFVRVCLLVKVQHLLVGYFGQPQRYLCLCHHVSFIFHPPSQLSFFSSASSSRGKPEKWRSRPWMTRSRSGCASTTSWCCPPSPSPSSICSLMIRCPFRTESSQLQFSCVRLRPSVLCLLLRWGQRVIRNSFIRPTKGWTKVYCDLPLDLVRNEEGDSPVKALLDPDRLNLANITDFRCTKKERQLVPRLMMASLFDIT